MCFFYTPALFFSIIPLVCMQEKTCGICEKNCHFTFSIEVLPSKKHCESFKKGCLVKRLRNFFAANNSHKKEALEKFTDFARESIEAVKGKIKKTSNGYSQLFFDQMKYPLIQARASLQVVWSSLEKQGNNSFTQLLQNVGLVKGVCDPSLMSKFILFLARNCAVVSIFKFYEDNEIPSPLEGELYSHVCLYMNELRNKVLEDNFFRDVINKNVLGVEQAYAEKTKIKKIKKDEKNGVFLEGKNGAMGEFPFKIRVLEQKREYKEEERHDQMSRDQIADDLEEVGLWNFYGDQEGVKVDVSSIYLSDFNKILFEHIWPMVKKKDF